MGVTNKEAGTNVNEIAAGIYRISTPVGPEVLPDHRQSHAPEQLVLAIA